MIMSRGISGRSHIISAMHNVQNRVQFVEVKLLAQKQNYKLTELFVFICSCEIVLSLMLSNLFLYTRLRFSVCENLIIKL